MASKGFEKSGQDLVVMLEDFFKKAPMLPKGGREMVVAITPWIALIFGILGVLAGVGAVGISPLALFAGFNASTTVLISGILMLVSSVLMLMAFPKLKQHHMGGWMLLFYSEVISIVSNVIRVDLVGALIGGLIGFYLLFQIKSYYK